MVFKRLLGSIGLGGPAVDTALSPGQVHPGGTLTGEVHLTGGKSDAEIEHITLELIARVEAETEEGEHHGDVVFERFTVGGGFPLKEGEQRTLPFAVTLPWETPVTELYGQPLGIVMGVRTELGVAGARDKGDLDPLSVGPLPAQEAILEAFGQLGFGFVSADLEYGRIGGTQQRLPFYQEIEISPAPQYAQAMSEVEVTFLAAPDAMEVVLEADKRSGYHPRGDVIARFSVSYENVGHTDWNAVVDGWLRHLLDLHTAHSFPGAHTGAHEGYDHAYGHGLGRAHGPTHGHGHAHDHGHGHGHDHGHGHRSGPGMGTVVAAGAAGLAVGVAGGLVAAEVVDEMGDFFEGEEDES
ncbi:sporulation protein [Streptomyces sp. NPDC057638]|uniref:sporulation protein n=1 Tax=Streptomyces sp. NPDC057638 TaxID=3346190 RepID=UPI00367822EB